MTQTENTTESVVRQNVRESEIHSINNKVVAQSAEDIQALVNRTLSKQMNTITERVYQQMEKRLQTERFRRGGSRRLRAAFPRGRRPPGPPAGPQARIPFRPSAQGIVPLRRDVGFLVLCEVILWRLRISFQELHRI